MEEAKQIANKISFYSAQLAAMDVELALQISAGVFVGLYTTYVRTQGHDPDKKIEIEGGEGQRAITIHALKDDG